MGTKTPKKIRLVGDLKPYLKCDETLQIFFNDIKPHKVLSQEETKSLFKQYHNGTKKERIVAFNKLCKHNMRLVVTLAREYCSPNDNLKDLIQEGSIGLMKAIELFNENNGTPFAGYSIYWIRRYINIFRTNMEPIIAKTNRSKTANVIITISNELYHKLERVPTPDEILDEYNLQHPNKPIKESNDLVSVEIMSIDVPETPQQAERARKEHRLYDDYNRVSGSYNDYLDDIDKEYNKKMLTQLLGELNEKEIKVIRLLYGLDSGIGRSLSVISTEMGLSKQRISRLCITALNKMRKKSKELSYSLR